MDQQSRNQERLLFFSAGPLSRQIREHQVLFLSLEDVLACGGGDVGAAAQDVLRGFELLARARVLQPHKVSVKPPNRGVETRSGLINTLPCYVEDEEHSYFGFKILGAMPGNVKVGLPRATGLILLYDGESKTPLCIMDAQAISATRTGAVTALAAQKLVDPGVEEVGLVGAGVNMRTQLLGLKHALPRLAKARVYSRRGSRFTFARQLSKRLNMKIVPVETPAEAVRDQQLVVTCLANVTTPIVRHDWYRQGGLSVFNIGCFESDAELLTTMDRLIADLWEHSRSRGVQTLPQAVSRGLVPGERVENLGPILLGHVDGRKSAEERIFFSPVGLGFEDALVGWRVFEQARRQGLGVRLTLWKNPRWI